MSEYKVIKDELDEYSILDSNNVIIITELERKIDADVMCDALNELDNDLQVIVNDLKECRARKEIIRQKLITYQKITKKHNQPSATKLESYIDELINENKSIHEENKRLQNTVKKQHMALCDFHNRETAQEKWKDKRPEFNLDKYYEVCMEEIGQSIPKAELRENIQSLINECEEEIQQIIDGEKDSYIVKHDIAIKKLKKLAQNNGVEL